MYKCRLSILIIAGVLIGLDGSEGFGSDVCIADKSEARAVIVLGQLTTTIEKHAADELAMYIKDISGAELKTVQSPKADRDSSDIILIGRPETNETIKSLVDKGLVKVSPDYPGLDGFVIKTVSVEGTNYLILSGSADRSIIYAVYHFLENFCDVGFFWDGDYLPQSKTIKVGNIDIAQRPHFPVRQYLQGCAFIYNAMNYWTWPQWKQELDWVAKMKLNRMMLPSAPNLFVSSIPKNPNPYQKYRMELSKRAIDYARRLGIKVIINGLPSKAFLDYYGTDHIYNVGLYGEIKVGNTPEEEKQIFVKAAKETMKKMKAIDPQGIWYMSGWTFYAPPRHIETVKTFLKVIPTDSFYIADVYAQRYPIYRKYHYFYGKTWGFGVLNSFGGDAYLHGDLSHLIRRVKEVVHDPRAKNCKVFYVNPEIIHYNTLYSDLATQLAWNSKRITLTKFLAGYAQRRYGKESSPVMLKVLKELSRNIYGAQGGDRPSYLHRITNTQFDLETLRYGNPLISQLHYVLETALSQKEHQSSNPLYGNDLVDWYRQYSAELFNYQLNKLNYAYNKRDERGFEEESKIISTLLTELEDVLFSRSDYRIASILKQVKSIPVVTPEIMRGAEKYLKNNVFTYVLTRELLDYQAKDMYELVKDYYRSRVEVYIQFLRNRLAGGNLGFNYSKDLVLRYEKVEKAWMNQPLPLYKIGSKNEVEAVDKAFANLEGLYRAYLSSLRKRSYLDSSKEWERMGPIYGVEGNYVLGSGDVLRSSPQVYGTFEARLKVASMRKRSFWGFFSKSGAPCATFLVEGNKLKLYVKTRFKATPGGLTNNKLAVDATQYHNYKIIWNEEGVKAYVDGKLFASTKEGFSPRVHLQASLISGSWGLTGTGNRIYCKALEVKDISGKVVHKLFFPRVE